MNHSADEFRLPRLAACCAGGALFFVPWIVAATAELLGLAYGAHSRLLLVYGALALAPAGLVPYGLGRERFVRVAAAYAALAAAAYALTWALV